MKESCVFLERFPLKTSKKLKKGTEKIQATMLKPKISKFIMKRYGLPPMAPHNTTGDIISFHPIVLFDEDELMGSNLNVLNSFA